MCLAAAGVADRLHRRVAAVRRQLWLVDVDRLGLRAEHGMKQVLLFRLAAGRLHGGGPGRTLAHVSKAVEASLFPRFTEAKGKQRRLCTPKPAARGIRELAEALPGLASQFKAWLVGQNPFLLRGQINQSLSGKKVVVPNKAQKQDDRHALLHGACTCCGSNGQPGLDQQ
eukprot:scaffold32856_cov16-Tisochrysis_lutea.AAC.1